MPKSYPVVALRKNYRNAHKVRAPRRMQKAQPKVRTLAKRIRTIENKEELKWNSDVYVTSVSVDNTGVFYDIPIVGQGVTNNLRIGNVIAASSVQIRLQAKINALNAASIHFRAILYWDSQPNGATATLNTILDTGIITDPTFAPHNYNYIKRYHILYDKMHTITPILQTASSITNNLMATATDTITTVAVVSKYMKIIKKLNRQVKFSTAGSTVAAIQTNNLGLLIVSDQSGNPPTCEVAIRFYYKDT